MPIFEYECEQGHVSSELFFAPSTPPEKMKCPECDSIAKRILSTDVAFVIPAYMRAQGSKGSTEDRSDENIAYMKTDKWRKKRQEIEAKGGEVTYGSECGSDLC